MTIYLYIIIITFIILANRELNNKIKSNRKFRDRAKSKFLLVNGVGTKRACALTIDKQNTAKVRAITDFILRVLFIAPVNLVQLLTLIL